MRALKLTAIALVTMVLLGVAGSLAWAWQEGYRAYAVKTGSMKPTYPPGDLVIDEPPPASYAVGDVITYRDSGGLTTHRVHAVGEKLETKGDANEKPDVGSLPPDRVVGRVIAAIPKGGYVVVFFQQPAGVAAVMTLCLTLFLLYGICFPSEDEDEAPYEPRHLHGPYRPRHLQPS